MIQLTIGEEMTALLLFLPESRTYGLTSDDTVIKSLTCVPECPGAGGSFGHPYV